MLCWLRQYRISSAMDGGRELSPALRRHVARCARCRSFQEGASRLHAVLSSAAAASVVSPCRMTRLPAWRRWTPAAAAAAVILVAAGWWTRLPPTDGEAGTPSLNLSPAVDLLPPGSPVAALDFAEAMTRHSLAVAREASADSFRREWEGWSQDIEAVASTLTSYLPPPMQLADMP